MKAFLADGQILEGSIIRLCTGYTAEKIEINANDVKQLINMLRNNPKHLKTLLYQLRYRFISERISK